MRVSLTIGFPHGGGPGRLIAAPGPDIAGQKAEFKKIRAAGHHPEFERIEVWMSDAGISRKCGLSKKPPKSPEAKPPETKDTKAKA